LSSDPANTIIGLARTASSVRSKLNADKITNVHILPADMIDHIALNEAAAEAAKLTNGSVDYLIVNGAHNDYDIAKLPPTSFIGREDVLRKDMAASLDVNVLGVMYSINAFLPLVRTSSVKKIIVISTGLADTENVPKNGLPTFVTYCAMKAALNMIVAKYSVELKKDGIILLALSPGIVATKETPRMQNLSFPTMCNRTVLTIQIATAEEIAEFQKLVKVVQKRKPDWKGPIMPAESVLLQKQVIDKVTIDESGSFLSHLGNREWI
jgi:NAD(P)-dependent dehydrogenase (short-subunit alcohol dehydrogenase family)